MMYYPPNTMRHHNPFYSAFLACFLVAACSATTSSLPNGDVTGALPVALENSPIAKDLAQNNDEDGDDDLTAEDAKEESLLDIALELTSTSQDFWVAGETEKAIEALDQAYVLILKTPVDADGKNSQQKDDLRFMVSKRLMEIYTSRLSAVNGKHKEIPLVINEHVEREIKLFQTVERDFFLESYKRSGRYRAAMLK